MPEDTVGATVVSVSGSFDAIVSKAKQGGKQEVFKKFEQELKAAWMLVVKAKQAAINEEAIFNALKAQKTAEYNVYLQSES